jgi:hypothetical protein
MKIQIANQVTTQITTTDDNPDDIPYVNIDDKLTVINHLYYLDWHPALLYELSLMLSSEIVIRAAVRIVILLIVVFYVPVN